MSLQNNRVISVVDGVVKAVVKLGLWSTRSGGDLQYPVAHIPVLVGQPPIAVPCLRALSIMSVNSTHCAHRHQRNPFHIHFPPGFPSVCNTILRAKTY